MTDEQINAAIAEACGWKSKGNNTWITQHGTPVFALDIPEFCTDLNAMHEAEKVLTSIQQGYYWDHLKDMTDEGFDQLHATACQRAGAFLRTLGKWEEAVVKESFTTEEAK
jgi:hypothetical protein